MPGYEAMSSYLQAGPSRQEPGDATLARRRDGRRRGASGPVAYVTYLRPYRSLSFVGLLVRLGLTTTERPYDAESQRIAASLKPDLVVVVIDPQGEDARATIREFSENSTALIAALGPGPGTEGFSELFAAGADICLRESDPPELLVAQLEAFLRRLGPADAADADAITHGPLRIDPRRCEVSWRGSRIPFAPMEFRILQHLAERPGHVVSAHDLMRAVHDYTPSEREARASAKVYVRRIRQKLEGFDGAANIISTVRGFGYFFDPPSTGIDADSFETSAITGNDASASAPGTRLHDT